MQRPQDAATEPSTPMPQTGTAELTPAPAIVSQPWFGPAIVGLGVFVTVLGVILLTRKNAKSVAATPPPDGRIDVLRDEVVRAAAELDAKSRSLDEMLDRAYAKLAELESIDVRSLREVKPGAPAEPVRVERPKPVAQPAESWHHDAFAMADQGMTAVQIAQRLQKPTGQIELVLNLRRAKIQL